MPKIASIARVKHETNEELFREINNTRSTSDSDRTSEGNRDKDKVPQRGKTVNS